MLLNRFSRSSSSLKKSCVNRLADDECATKKLDAIASNIFLFIKALRFYCIKHYFTINIKNKKRETCQERRRLVGYVEFYVTVNSIISTSAPANVCQLKQYDSKKASCIGFAERASGEDMRCK